MDGLRASLWLEIRNIFPEGAEAWQPDGRGSLEVSWHLPSEGRPERRSREVSIRFQEPVVAVLKARFRAFGDVGLVSIAPRISTVVRRTLATGHYDAEQADRVPFLAYVGAEVLD